MQLFSQLKILSIYIEQSGGEAVVHLAIFCGFFFIFSSGGEFALVIVVMCSL